MLLFCTKSETLGRNMDTLARSSAPPLPRTPLVSGFDVTPVPSRKRGRVLAKRAIIKAEAGSEKRKKLCESSSFFSVEMPPPCGIMALDSCDKENNPETVDKNTLLLRTLDDLMRDIKQKREFVVSMMQSSGLAPRLTARGYVVSVIRKLRKVDLFDYKSAQKHLLVERTEFPSAVVNITMAYLYHEEPPKSFGINFNALTEGTRLDVRRKDGWWAEGLVLSVSGIESLEVEFKTNENETIQERIKPSEKYRLAPLGKFTRRRDGSSSSSRSSSIGFKLNDDVRVWRFAPATKRKWVPGVITHIIGEQLQVVYFFKKVKPYTCWFHLRSGEIVTNDC
eukprot:jgi/Bigna1/86924/estExt_fgenesh1_pg.C_150075